MPATVRSTAARDAATVGSANDRADAVRSASISGPDGTNHRTAYENGAGLNHEARQRDRYDKSSRSRRAGEDLDRRGLDRRGTILRWRNLSIPVQVQFPERSRGQENFFLVNDAITVSIQHREELVFHTRDGCNGWPDEHRSWFGKHRGFDHNGRARGKQTAEDAADGAGDY
jgi:hypothetical protein